ncbi:MAG: zf-HC2 domain-containing protein [Chloroflexi bacterium]|nr:zf-HC2 domain-containing protein [Chloroflexota bacterium]
MDEFHKNDNHVNDIHLHHLNPNGRNCSEIMLELSEFVDGALPKSLCDEIEHHLHECPECTIVVDTLRKTINLYQECSKADELPHEVRERLYKKLNLDDYLQNR